MMGNFIRVVALGVFVTMALGWAAVGGSQSVHAAQTQNMTMAEAINKAGRQRMLSQRIVKAYSQVGQDVLPDEAQRQIDRSIALYLEQLKYLKAFSTDPAVHETLELAANIWREMSQLVGEPAVRSRAQRLLYLSEDLLYMSDKVVRLLQDSSNTSLARMINISGRQRMLSQRMAKLYMMKAWGVDVRSLDDDLDLAIAMFGEGLRELHDAKESNDEIRRELGIVDLQWEWFRHALSIEGNRSYSLIVVDSSESILRSMEILTGLYERLATTTKKTD